MDVEVRAEAMTLTAIMPGVIGWAVELIPATPPFPASTPSNAVSIMGNSISAIPNPGDVDITDGWVEAVA